MRGLVRIIKISFIIPALSRNLIIIVLVGVIQSCSQPAQRHVHFFAFDSLLQSQARHLASLSPAITKEVSAGGRAESVALYLKDSAAWMSELEVFRQLEQLNNPRFRDQYIDSIQADVSSNLMVHSFRATSSQPLQEVKIYYLDEPTRFKKITSVIREQNPLYKSSRQLELIFSEVHNKTILTSYSIAGGQRMVLGDTVQFNSKGTISIQ